MGSRPAGGGRVDLSAAGDRPGSLDLRVFAPVPAPGTARWRHAIRRLDPGSRLRVRELTDLEGFDGATVVTTLRREFWELRSAGRAATVRSVDSQRRVAVPLGVRHQLGLDGAVVVSLAADRSRIAVWPATRLDELLEVRP